MDIQKLLYFIFSFKRVFSVNHFETSAKSKKFRINLVNEVKEKVYTELVLSVRSNVIINSIYACCCRTIC